ncbi:MULTISPECIES: glutamine synthetase [Streptococcus]|uniref:Glutamine synthetase n=1 Tax=Streptococcus pseudopneumoniae TaxID=257758 RepID=A0AAW4C9N5_9STRE|nr:MULTISPECIES: glutamine synthetase [Streptococcus]MBF9674485.1 glutamine synthetase [Streptococcus pseudopneumoniae]MBF9678806.1 glutamine synthetase [Streptococcus pseudopneumoniae]NIB64701.1 glutamine synthetase [Streptococcus pseudopneumoniae]
MLDIVFEIEFFHSDSFIFFYTSDDKSNSQKSQEDFSKNK